MTFQAYIDNSQAKTGKTPADFKAMAAERASCDPTLADYRLCAHC